MANQPYQRAVHVSRIATAFLFAAGGAGLIVCASLRIRGMPIYASLGLLAVGAVVFALLVLEQLAAVWFTCRGRFSMAGLMLVTAAASIFFAVFRNSTTLAIALLCVGLTIAAACLESRRIP